MKKAFLACLLSTAVLLAGCSYATAQKTVNIIGSIIAVAQADLPSLEATGIIPLPQQAVVNAVLSLAGSLDTQAATCITQAQTAPNAKSAFATCFQVFATNFVSSAELAALHILSGPAQQAVNVWVAAITTALYSVIIAFGGVVPASLKANTLNSSDYNTFMNKVKADYKVNPHRVMQ